MMDTRLQVAAAPKCEAFPDQGILFDLAGRPVDASSWHWRLNNPSHEILLNWRRVSILSGEVLTASVQYAAQLVRLRSPATVRSWFSALVAVCALPQFKYAALSGEPLGFAPFKELMDAGGSTGRENARKLMHWYRWACDQGFEQFDPDVAFRLATTTFGSSPKGRAVLSLDPEEGPLLDVELVALLNALRAADETGKIGLQERVAVWLCLALGANPGQFVMLRDGDFERIDGIGKESIYQLSVPRIKKRYAQERSEFKVRKLVPELGRMVEELLKRNRERCRREFNEDGAPSVAVPLFMRNGPRLTLPEVLGEFKASMTRGDFTEMVAASVEALGVMSPRTGRVLRVTTRRFRYTFATRLVREGASQRVVAEALDHSDLQHVQVYFDLKSDIVEKLDTAMALTLGPLSQAFLGHLVHNEQDAVRGESKGSRIYRHARNEGRIEPIGTCGSFSFCGLTAPVACYTCIKFQPWVDAPHEQVLADLLAERNRREESGLDGKMVGLMDTAILAVADVVTRAAAIKEVA